MSFNELELISLIGDLIVFILILISLIIGLIMWKRRKQEEKEDLSMFDS